MASIPEYGAFDVARADFACPACLWRGKGSAARVVQKDVIRCPHCDTPLERIVKGATGLLHPVWLRELLARRQI